MLNDKINVINVGTDVFADAIKEQGIPAEKVYIQGENQHFEINKHTLASGNILLDD